MNQQEIYKTVLTAVVKVQSAIHDLDSLPIESDFTKQLKRECNQMLAQNRNFVTRTEKLVDAKFTALMDNETCDSYSEIVKKFDDLGQTINVFEV